MMTVGAGGIAGTVEAGDDPPVGKRKKKKMVKYISLARGTFSDGVMDDNTNVNAAILERLEKVVQSLQENL